MSGPLTAVLDAYRAGAVTDAEASRATGLSLDVVGAAVDHLVRMGRLERQVLTFGCPSSGCGSCPLACAASGEARGQG